MTDKPDSRKQFILPADIRDLLLSYLYQRPYGEVASGVALLQGLAEAPETKALPGLRAVPEPSDFPPQAGAPDLPPGLPTN